VNELAFTLVSDGSSDRALIPLLHWVLSHNGVSMPIQGIWADLSRLPRRPASLAERIRRAVELYPCDLVFVHRDAEAALPAARRTEIAAGTAAAGLQAPFIPVIPVRMTEAWFLFDEGAIRMASGNPNGARKLGLPRARDWDRMADPKAALEAVMRLACGLKGRRLRALDLAGSVHRIASLTQDYSPLRRLAAFADLEAEVARVANAQHWT
jgi:hypothetical protein